MVIKQGPHTVGQTFLATRYPVEEGLEAATTKQTDKPNLEAEEEGTF